MTPMWQKLKSWLFDTPILVVMPEHIALPPRQPGETGKLEFEGLNRWLEDGDRVSFDGEEFIVRTPEGLEEEERITEELMQDRATCPCPLCKALSCLPTKLGPGWQSCMFHGPKTKTFWLYDGKDVVRTSAAVQFVDGQPTACGYIRDDDHEFFEELDDNWWFMEIHEPVPPDIGVTIDSKRKTWSVEIDGPLGGSGGKGPVDIPGGGSAGEGDAVRLGRGGGGQGHPPQPGPGTVDERTEQMFELRIRVPKEVYDRYQAIQAQENAAGRPFRLQQVIDCGLGVIEREGVKPLEINIEGVGHRHPPKQDPKTLRSVLQTMALMRSMIDGGEHWTPTSKQAYADAHEALARFIAPVEVERVRKKSPLARHTAEKARGDCESKEFTEVPVVRVRWKDSMGHASVWCDVAEWNPKDDCESVGYLVRETEDAYYIGAHLHGEEGISQAGGVMRIPKVCVTSFEVISGIGNDALWGKQN